jgi:hypothetical protein
MRKVVEDEVRAVGFGTVMAHSHFLAAETPRNSSAGILRGMA